MTEARWTASGECPAMGLGRSVVPNFSGALYPRRGARNFSPRSAAATFHPVFPLYQPAGTRGKSPKGLPYPRAVSLERNHPAFADQHMARVARSPGIADTASPADSYGFAPGGPTFGPLPLPLCFLAGTVARFVSPGVRLKEVEFYQELLLYTGPSYSVFQRFQEPKALNLGLVGTDD